MLPGERGFGVPGSGGSRRRTAVTGLPPSVPARPPLPWFDAAAAPLNSWPVPLTHDTVPLSLCGAFFGPSSRRSLPPSVPWMLLRLTNCPDCLTSNDGPPGAGCVGAVLGYCTGVGGAGLPRHALGAVAS